MASSLIYRIFSMDDKDDLETTENGSRELQDSLLGPSSVPNSVFEVRIAPDGSTSRRVRRDVVRKAASG